MRQEIRELINENHNRRMKIYGPYDQLTGVGCYGFDKGERVHVHIPDFAFSLNDEPIADMWVPKETLETGIWNEVLRYGSIQRFVENNMGRHFDEDYHLDVVMALLQARAYDDPELAFLICDKIVQKLTGSMTPFRPR